MRFKNFSPLVLLVSMFASIGCSEETPAVIPNLNLNSDLIEVAAEGGSATIGYQLTDPVKDATIEILNKEEWLADFEISANLISFNVAPNQEESSREAKITLTYPNLKEDVFFTVRQRGCTSLSIEKTVVEVPCDGEKVQIAYTLQNPLSGESLKVNCEDEWVKDLTATEHEITFEIERNLVMTARETAITVEYANVEPQEIAVKQAAALPSVINVDTKKIDIPAEGGNGEVGYTIQNPVEGEVISVASEAQWIENLKADNQKITFNVAKNDASDTRSTSIKVNYKNAEEVSLVVNQAASQSNEMVIEANGVKFKMIYVKGGTFQMGATDEQIGASSDEYPAHKVTLSDYYIGQYEVTQELWKAVTGTNPSANTDNPQLPVENICWDDCQSFITKLNSLTGKKFALPTEAQWEYAARGGEKARGLLFSGSDFSDEVAWFDKTGTNPVGQLLPNELGIFDMSGNVYEWCSDLYGDYTEEEQTDPAGVADGWAHVLRGGCYYEWEESKVRVACRHMDASDTCDDGYGLRLILTK